MLRVGMIGCGNIVRHGHRPPLIALEDVQLVALADVTEGRRKIGQEWFSLPDSALYDHHSGLLARDDIDAVIVTVPQQFRYEIVMDAIRAGKHVLSEKPIASTPEVADKLIQAAEDAGLVFGMVHNYIYLPEYYRIKELVDIGTIGDLRVLTMHYLGTIDNPGALEYKPDWRHTMDAGGGVLMDMIHAVYLSEWLFDAPAQQVMAFADAPEYAQREPLVEDLILMQIAFPTGYAAIHMGWGQGVGGVDASGSEGHLRMRYKKYQTSGFNQPEELYSVRDWVRTDYAFDNLPDPMETTGQSFTGIWADFRDAIQTGRQSVMPASSGKRALEIALGGYLSSVTGRVVTLPLPVDHPVYQRGIAGMRDVDVWEYSRTKTAGLFGLRE